jgi:hypothetical protein
MAGKKLGQMALEDGHTAFAQGLHFGFVLVHADDLVADLGKTDSSYESDVSGPDHTDGNWLRHTQALSPLWIALEQEVNAKLAPGH